MSEPDKIYTNKSLNQINNSLNVAFELTLSVFIGLNINQKELGEIQMTKLHFKVHVMKNLWMKKRGKIFQKTTMK